MNTYGVVGVVGREYIWRHRGVVGRQYIWRGVNTYGVGVVGRQYIWRHRWWWGVNTYGVIGGGGASIHMAS